jgi:Tfp pilus assembly protein PilX
MTTKTMPAGFSVRTKQRGVALFVGLIMLLILTLLGLSASNVSIMQERMAGNVSQYNQSFQIAESVLREVETRIYNGICIGGGSGGFGVIPTMDSLGVDPNDCTLSGVTAPAWQDAPGITQPTRGWACYFAVELPPNRCREIASSREGNLLTGKSYIVLASGQAEAEQSEVVVQSIISCVQG